ncbi:hypothetical protein RND81_05G036600 [Saponaria officinalis]|uniref:CCHC-type domain-containing protein n=1 Tax=Saponaria officinalis TaxID=3572 RepID=A0AAW1KXG2_SAPOF
MNSVKMIWTKYLGALNVLFTILFYRKSGTTGLPPHVCSDLIIAPIPHSPVSEAVNEAETNDVVLIPAAPVSNTYSLAGPSLVDPITDASKGGSTWADVVKDMGKSQEGMSLFFHEEISGMEEIEIEMEDIQDELNSWNNTLMGTVLGAKLTLKQISDFAVKSWSHIASPYVQYFRKGWFCFRFSSLEQLNEVLKAGPWKMDRVSIVPIWVLFPGLDPYLWTDIFLSKLASKVGKPLFADKTTTCQARLSFARVMIEVDVAAPLVNHVFMTTPFTGSFCQPVEYEWVPYHCFECGKLGHEVKNCRVGKAKAKVTNQVVVEPVSAPSPAKVSPEVVAPDSVCQTLGGTSGPNMGIPDHDGKTRIRQSKATKIANTMFPHYQVICNYSYHNNGRIWILWRPTTVSVRTIEVNSQYIHCHITHYNSCTEFSVTFVYASNDPLRCGGEDKHNPPCLHDILDFNACLLNCALDDIQSSGCAFTWSNKQEGAARVWCKLDRALANYQWLSKFPSSSAHFLPAGVSDHSPWFSFLNCWLADPSFQGVVQKAWDVPIYGSIMFCFFGKLKNVRKDLTDMHRRKLENCQENIHIYPTSATLLQEEKDLLASYTKLREIELTILRQRAKFENLTQNDTERQQSRFIGVIEDHHGQLKSSLNEVAGAFVDYYTAILGLDQTVNALDRGIISDGDCLTTADGEALCRPVQDREIWEALKGIGQNKNPGPDGFSSGFFLNSWNEFFRTSRLIKKANSTLVALIPKKKVIKSVLDFRPISCCSILLQEVMAKSLVKGYGRKFLTPRCFVTPPTREP